MQPYTALLYKSCPAAPGRMDLIGLFGLFVQPVTDDRVRAHTPSTDNTPTLTTSSHPAN